MRDSENSKGNGAAGGTERPLQDPRSISDHGRQIHHDAHALAAAVQEAADDLERYLTEQVEQRPYTTLGVAAGVGYVLGGGLRSRLTAVLFGATTRFAMALAARELAARLSPGASASVQNKSS
ncbi:MAG: hypothetical protein HY699_09240 [Deltaproteobacteria bacterium]|nr:hypothetical protein [Deltaproteobacteria bacterium]